MKNTSIHGILLFIFIALIGCRPETDDKADLGDPAPASFEIVPASAANTYILRSTGSDAFLYKWDLGDGTTAQGAEVQAYYPYKGTYVVTLTALSKGGSDIASKVITVTTDDTKCSGNLAMLTNCSSKTWKISTEPGGLHVGPNLTETWWGSSAADVAARPCHFDNEYIFSVDGTYEIKDFGDFWAEADNQGKVFPAALNLPVGCNKTADLPAPYKAWAGGKHQFAVTTTTLTVSGSGAWIGLYKLGTNSEVDSPQQSVTMKISEIKENRLVVYGDYGGVVWRITMVPK